LILMPRMWREDVGEFMIPDCCGWILRMLKRVCLRYGES
jgi:hypothetical protein